MLLNRYEKHSSDKYKGVNADYACRFSQDMTLIDQTLPVATFTTTFGTPVNVPRHRRAYN